MYFRCSLILTFKNLTTIKTEFFIILVYIFQVFGKKDTLRFSRWQLWKYSGEMYSYALFLIKMRLIFEFSIIVVLTNIVMNSNISRMWSKKSTSGFSEYLSVSILLIEIVLNTKGSPWKSPILVKCNKTRTTSNFYETSVVL